jgi:hypothetical protein
MGSGISLVSSASYQKSRGFLYEGAPCSAINLNLFPQSLAEALRGLSFLGEVIFCEEGASRFSGVKYLF